MTVKLQIIKIREITDSFVEMLVRNVGTSELPTGALAYRQTLRNGGVKDDTALNSTTLAPGESTELTVGDLSHSKAVHFTAYKPRNGGAIPAKGSLKVGFYKWKINEPDIL